MLDKCSNCKDNIYAWYCMSCNTKIILEDKYKKADKILEEFIDEVWDINNANLLWYALWINKKCED